MPKSKKGLTLRVKTRPWMYNPDCLDNNMAVGLYDDFTANP